MNRLARAVPGMFLFLLLVGCASSTLTARHEYKGGKVARPDHILIYDFAATSADVPPNSAMAGQYSEHSALQTPDQIATGRQVGAKISQVLVAEIRGMGLPAERATNLSVPQIGDLVIRGYILSIEKGSTTERLAIGFGSGSSHLKTTVEGYLMTDRGLRRLGSGTDEVGGSKSPGAAVGLAGAIATGNPAGLIVSSAMKVHGETSGSSTIEGRAEQTAKDIATQLQKKFKEQGWI